MVRLTSGIAICSVQHSLVGGLHGACVLYCKRVLHPQSPVRPQRQIVAALEVLDLCNELIAQGGGGFGGEEELGLLPWLMDGTGRRSSLGLRDLARVGRSMDSSRGLQQIRSIEVVLAGNADQGEQCIAPGVAQSGSHSVGGGGFADGADRPIRRDPFPGSMSQQRGQPDLAGVLIDGGGLDSGDLVLAKGLADNIKATCERGIAEGSVPFPWEPDFCLIRKA